MSVYKEEERKFLLKWIQIYKSLPALWKIKSEEYMNREKKNEAYNLLLNFYRQRYPNADKEEMKKKINSLRTNFRKELKKKTAAIEGDLHDTTSWYFNEMLFLVDQDQEDRMEIKIEEHETVVKVHPEVSAPRRSSHQDVSTDRFRPSHDEYEQLAAIWANELRKMEPLQQLYAKKAINDVIFEGQLGMLHRHSVVINGPSSGN